MEKSNNNYHFPWLCYKLCEFYQYSVSDMCIYIYIYTHTHIIMRVSCRSPTDLRYFPTNFSPQLSHGLTGPSHAAAHHARASTLGFEDFGPPLKLLGTGPGTDGGVPQWYPEVIYSWIFMGFSSISHAFLGSISGNHQARYPPVTCYIAMENHDAISGKTHDF